MQEGYLKPNERLDDLHRNNYKIIQNTNKFASVWMQFYYGFH